ncbi:cytochrome c biogenesis protein CcdA [Nocardiopsis sp. NPDC049922]|uniref:cytochrome c biogenesis CcdA family protein n=1 Tax=Nocardiopsis sp. NPDC049922 TaxID=3155157 RepID=UPI0033C7F606
MNIAQIVTSGPLSFAALLALVAGAITFASPCCLPLVPGYLSYIAGMSGAEGQDGRRGGVLRSRAVIGTVLFVAGFSGLFAAYGALFGGLGGLLLEYEDTMIRVLGILTIILGLGLPFLLVTLGLSKVIRAVSWTRRRGDFVSRIGGAMMVLLGIAQVRGVWSSFMTDMQRLAGGYTLPL